MKLYELMISKKSFLEKAKILHFRFRKLKYINITKKNQNVKVKANENLIIPIKPFLNDVLIENAKNSQEQIINEAELLYDNIYRTISGKKIKIINMNWNRDYVFKYTWEKKHYSEYVLKDPNIVTDVKHIWELSRFYHLVILAQAFALTKEEKYVEKIIEDIETWCEQNPINNSVNWTVSMEVSIRAVNLIQTISLIYDSKLITNRFLKKIHRIIIYHGIYIYNNLEKGITTNNHYLANLIGLIWIGLYLKNSNDKKIHKLSTKWIENSLNQLEYELDYQIYDDGFCYEDSIPYHGLNTEMLLLTVIALEENGVSFPRNIKNKLVSMLDSLYKLLIEFEIPVFGDLDNGKLIIIDVKSIMNKLSVKYLYDIAKRYNIYNYKLVEIKSPIIFKDSGFYRLLNENYDLTIKAGKIGLNGIGGHAHNDQLSFVLTTNNQKIIIDPGTGYYSGDYELRKKLRSTNSHNTLSIEGYEQNDISKDLFKMIPRTKTKLITCNNSYFEGEHYGYVEELKVISHREIQLNGRQLIIKDKINKKVNHKVYTSFVLDVNVEILFYNENKITIKKENVIIDVKVTGGRIAITDQLISKSYSEIILTKKIAIKFNKKEVISNFWLR